MESNTFSLSDLDKRRRELGMSCALLSQRCGVSRPTVQRILSGRQVAASVENVAAIAAALGLALRFDVSVEPMTFKRQQAERKARRLVGFVQGTSGRLAGCVSPHFKCFLMRHHSSFRPFDTSASFALSLATISSGGRFASEPTSILTRTFMS
jgi:transcriptional regulator with XRE-family HTH domain